MNRHCILPSAFALLAASVVFQSCDFFKKGGGEADSTVVAPQLKFSTVTYVDTLQVAGCSVSQSMTVAFPSADATGALADSLRAYLKAAVGSHSCPMLGEEFGQQKIDFDYAVGEEQAFLSASAGEGTARMVAEVNRAAEEGYSVNYENQYTARSAYQTDSLLTLEENYSIYTGGAHGTYTATGVTFRRSDGRRMGWNLFDMSKKAEIIGLIKEQLRQYFAFEEGAQPISEEALFEQLQLWDNPDTPENELEFGIPLPASEPYVVADGIAIVYQQYEIASYACGLPSGIIPLEKARYVLSAEGLSLLFPESE